MTKAEIKDLYKMMFTEYPDIVDAEQLGKMLGGVSAQNSLVLQTFYNKLIINGVALKDIQEWLGHSDISTTSNIYTHLDFSSKVASAEAIMPYYPK